MNNHKVLREGRWWLNFMARGNFGRGTKQDEWKGRMVVLDWERAHFLSGLFLIVAIEFNLITKYRSRNIYDQLHKNSGEAEAYSKLMIRKVVRHKYYFVPDIQLPNGAHMIYIDSISGCKSFSRLHFLWARVSRPLRYPASYISIPVQAIIAALSVQR